MKTSITHLALRICLVLATLNSLLNANAYDFVVDGIYYEINGNDVAVTCQTWDGYNNYTGNLTIPSTVSYQGKNYPVTAIGESAFAYSGVTSIYIPNSVTRIGDGAFAECFELTNISIPNSVAYIGSGAFSYCSELTNISIPNSVTYMGSGAFEETGWYSNQPDGLVYAGLVLYKYKGTMPNGTSISITEGTKGIAGGAFEYCDELTSITIPNSVTSIGDRAFVHCNGLTSITIPNSITSIGWDAYSECSSLTYVNITDIDAWCRISFENATSNPLYYAHHLYINGSEATNLVIPNSITSISNYAFYNCSELTSVSIPNSVTNIGTNAFSGCI